MSSLKCPYCGGSTKLVSASYVYHTNKYKGNMYVCENYPTCNSYVGCHPNTTKPLGRLANKELRHMKEKAHYYFDELWKKKTFSENKSISKNRYLAYRWLAEQLNLNSDDCHIGLFDEDMCRKVISICKKRQIELGLYEPKQILSRGYIRK